jgi:hypothetical protein
MAAMRRCATGGAYLIPQLKRWKLARALTTRELVLRGEADALVRLVGWMVTLKELALWMRCSRCGRKAAEMVAVARPQAAEALSI